MSWLYSRALVEEYSRDTFSAGARYVLSKSSPTLPTFSSPDRTMASFLSFPSGMTCGVLTDGLGAELLTWFREASRARTSASQERVQASLDSVRDYGRNLRGSLARYDRDSCTWKTAQCSFLEDSEPSSVTWPRWGTTVAGELYPLPTLVPSTPVSGSGLWPTPTVNGNYNRKGASKTSGDGLATAVAKRLYPTPSAGNEKWNGTIQEWGGSWNWVRKENPTLARSPLNPNWVEWLMGWPIGWTDLGASEMDKSPSAQPTLGACLPEPCDA